MLTAAIPAKQRFVLDCVPWDTYTLMLRRFEGRHLRITYDRGRLEIMTLSFEHEKGYFFGRLVDVLTEELKLPVEGGKSTTFRRRKYKRGLEADGCWWIENAHLVRGKKRIDLRVDPPPDLALEVEVTRSAVNRLAIYAKLKVPEVWRYNGKRLSFVVLNAHGKYEASATSLAFAMLTPDDVLPFLQKRVDTEKNELVAQFRTWVRQHLLPRDTDGAATSPTPSPAE